MSDQDRNIAKNEEQDEDVEAHRIYLKNEEGTDDVTRLNSDEEPDVEGHMTRLRNDEGAEDVTRLNSDEEPDVEGHRVVPKTVL